MIFLQGIAVMSLVQPSQFQRSSMVLVLQEAACLHPLGSMA